MPPSHRAAPAVQMISIRAQLLPQDAQDDFDRAGDLGWQARRQDDLGEQSIGQRARAYDDGRALAHDAALTGVDLSQPGAPRHLVTPLGACHCPSRPDDAGLRHVEL